MPKLRKLAFASIDQIAVDIQNLRDSSYEQGGSWNLSQVCEHLAKTLEVGLRGNLPPQGPWIVRATVFRVLFDIVIATGWMPSGAQAPPEIQPGDRSDDDPAAIDRCLALLTEARDRTEPLPPFPFASGMHLAKWKKLQRVHCAHHLAFLKPKVA